MSFQCCPLPQKQILWLFAGDEFFLVERLGTFADHQPFSDSAAKRVPALKKKEKQFPFQSVEDQKYDLLN